MRLFLSVISLLLFSGIFHGCTSDEAPAPNEGPGSPGSCDTVAVSYKLNIKPIIDQSCAYSGCHPNFSTYSGLQPYLRSGVLKERVINRKDDPVFGMPPNSAPAGRPKDLTAAQIRLIDCWLAKGYPE